MTANIRPLVITARCTSDSDGPEFAVIDDARDLLEKTIRLQALVSENNLSELRIHDHPECWGPGDIEDDLRLQCGEFVVCSSSAWFVDVPKHANYTIETENFDVVQLQRLLEEGDGPIFLGADPAELKRFYDELNKEEEGVDPDDEA